MARLRARSNGTGPLEATPFKAAYKSACRQSVLEADVVEAREMGGEGDGEGDEGGESTSAKDSWGSGPNRACCSGVK